MKVPVDTNEPVFLGIEGGGTRTVAILATAQGRLLKRLETGPSNLKLLDDTQLEQNLLNIAAQMPTPDAVGIGLAGTWSQQDCSRIQAAAGKAWPGVPCHPSSDLETALAAAEALPSIATKPQKAPRKSASPNAPNRVLVLSGTGSCCFGKDTQGQTIKVGSGGHMVADIGSAFQVSVEALRGTFSRFEETGRWPNLGTRLLRVLQFTEPDALIGWANTAGKAEISGLAPEVLQAWDDGDAIATRVVDKASRDLARQALVCAKRLHYSGNKITFVLSGSMLVRQLGFQKAVSAHLKRLKPGCTVVPLHRESVWGAVELASRLWAGKLCVRGGHLPSSPPLLPLSSPGALPTTEQRNPRSLNLDKLSIPAAIELMLSEDARIPEVLRRYRGEIAAAIRLIVKSFRAGGRLFYVGAGTSGRLGVLDASECPPTFRSPPDLVQGVMAGGQLALWQSLEGAEDDYGGGARVMAARNLKRADVVVGIAASGTTPFVWGAFSHARKIGAATVLVCFNSGLQIPAEIRPQVVIAPNVGPEVLTGSTRLKAGTATKLLLNIFTTLAMVRMGKVRSNLMVDLVPSNDKLRDRAVRIVRELTGATAVNALAALKQNDWVIERALTAALPPGASPHIARATKQSKVVV